VTKTGIRGVAILIAVACGIVFSGAATAQEKITIWWVKGFYKSEDAALFAAIKKFEDKAGVKVDLSQYAVQDMIPKTVSALDAGTPPDVAYADVYDFQVAGKWAFEGKLETFRRHRSDAGARAQHRRDCVPLQRQDQEESLTTLPLSSRRCMCNIDRHVASGGFHESDIPTTWKEYWSFWCDKVQPGSRKATASAPSESASRSASIAATVLLVPNLYGRL
jgi:multiple sugar transport system substrate-binding protein